MDKPTIHGRRPVFSENNLLQAAGDAILEIKHQDNLTWSDIGKVLGVSDDSAAKYASGFACMTFATFMRGKREWGGRFAGPVERLVIASRPGSVSGNMAMMHMLSASSAICAAMEDGELTAREIRENRHLFEKARDELDSILRSSEVRAA